MFKAMLALQWKAARWGVLLLTPLCLGLPILLLTLAHETSQGAFADPAMDMLRFVQVLAPIFPVLAAVTGAAFGLAVWSWDHRTNHIYALALPVERWRYSLLKMATGAIIMAIPIAAVFLGAFIATTTTALPAAVHSYAFAFGVRFLLACLITYAVCFAFASGTIRTTARILVALFVIFIFGSLLTDVAGQAFGIQIPSPLGILAYALTSWAGPFKVFGGSWMLIDV